eukprot:SAG11_NODE_638_length_8025_cov_14.591093_6_plen_163_part_00
MINCLEKIPPIRASEDIVREGQKGGVEINGTHYCTSTSNAAALLQIPCFLSFLELQKQFVELALSAAPTGCWKETSGSYNTVFKAASSRLLQQRRTMALNANTQPAPSARLEYAPTDRVTRSPTTARGSGLSGPNAVPIAEAVNRPARTCTFKKPRMVDASA